MSSTHTSLCLTVTGENIRHIQRNTKDNTRRHLKSVPLQAPRCPEGSRKLSFPDYVKMAQDGGKVVSLTHRPLFTPGNNPGTHFC